MNHTVNNKVIHTTDCSLGGVDLFKELAVYWLTNYRKTLTVEVELCHLIVDHRGDNNLASNKLTISFIKDFTVYSSYNKRKAYHRR